MALMDQVNHRAPVCINKDGVSRTTDLINPNSDLRLGANVADTGIAANNIQAICQLMKIAEQLNLSGFTIDFIPSCYHSDLLGDAPTIYLNNAAGTDWGGIRWNPSTSKLQFRHVKAGVWADLGSGGALGTGDKITYTIGTTVYDFGINHTTGDVEFFEGGVRRFRITHAGATHSSIVFDADVQLTGVNSDIDFNLLTAKILIGKALDIESTSWRIFGTGITTGLTARGGYTLDI